MKIHHDMVDFHGHSSTIFTVRSQRAGAVPMGGQMQAGAIQVEGTDTSINMDWRSVSADYFRALDVPILAGRTFTENDSAERPAVGAIDERLCRLGYSAPCSTA